MSNAEYVLLSIQFHHLIRFTILLVVRGRYERTAVLDDGSQAGLRLEY